MNVSRLCRVASVLPSRDNTSVEQGRTAYDMA